MYDELFKNHKKRLVEEFKTYDRELFNENGYTECPVTSYTFEIDDFINISRINVKDSDVQFGHCICRSDNIFATRGFNIVLMSRKGNTILGNDNFLSNKWLDTINKIYMKFNKK